MDLHALLLHAVQAGASDVHLKVGQPPVLRHDGALDALDGWPPLDEPQLEAVLATVTAEDPARRSAFDETGELDLAYTPAGLPRFRVNGFRQRGAISFAFRVIPSAVPSFADLGLPEGVALLAEEQRGLVLCTGATGSGKSTTLAAIVGHINATRRCTSSRSRTRSSSSTTTGRASSTSARSGSTPPRSARRCAARCARTPT